MAKNPEWTRQEWLVALDHFLEHGRVRNRPVVESLSETLRLSAFDSADAELRNAVWNEGFRSQSSARRSLAEIADLYERAKDWEFGHENRTLREVWQETSWGNPELVRELAEPYRWRSEGDLPLLYEDRAMLDDKELLRRFCGEVWQLLKYVVRVFDSLPTGYLNVANLEQQKAAIVELEALDPIKQQSELIEEASRSLPAFGLTGEQLAYKIQHWRESSREFFRVKSIGALRRALRWANLLLGSLSAAIPGGPFEIIKEMKDGSEVTIDGLYENGMIPLAA